MFTQSQEMEVALIKRLITGGKTLCPKCGQTELTHFHQKAKKSNTDYLCPNCKQRYQVVKMMAEIE